MNKFKKMLISAGVVLAIGAVSVTALAASYGSSAVESGKTYTLTQMLTYALQDENLAYAEYVKINEAFDAARPFANIVRAEKTHIAALERLFSANGIALPENTAGTYVTVPASLTDALKAGVQAEKSNIAMYEKFLSQTLPDDVKAVFTALKNASEQHLAAFERGLSGSAEAPARNGNGNRGNGLMNGSSGGNRGNGTMNRQASCDGTDACGATDCTGSGTGSMNRGQGRGQGGAGTCDGTCEHQD